jgi:hypothetical protein
MLLDNLLVPGKPSSNFCYSTSFTNFRDIPGSPIAYWVSQKVLNIFTQCEPLKNFANARVGMMTSDNAQFLKFWWEVFQNTICFDATSSEIAQNSKKKWFPHNKGGPFRKWSGNQDYVVNWENNGKKIKETIVNKYPYLKGNPNFAVHDDGYYFKPSVSWSQVTSGIVGFRAYPPGFTFNLNGMSAFESPRCSYEQLLMFCNSKFVNKITKIINPTLNFGIGDFNSLPAALIPHNQIVNNVEKLILIAQQDWDNFEISWNFSSLSLLHLEHHSKTLASSYANLRYHWQERTIEMKRLEEENNNLTRMNPNTKKTYT